VVLAERFYRVRLGIHEFETGAILVLPLVLGFEERPDDDRVSLHGLGILADV
jgi:hypothetical protein